MEEVDDSPDFWSRPVQFYNSPVEHRFLIGMDWSTNGLLPDCDRRYVSVQTMPPGIAVLEMINEYRQKWSHRKGSKQLSK